MSRVIPIRELAPPAPPCFPSRSIWLSYLEGAIEFARRRRVSSPVLTSGQFNTEFRFCTDCLAEKKAAEVKQGNCKPTWLKDLSKATA